MRTKSLFRFPWVLVSIWVAHGAQPTTSVAQEISLPIGAPAPSAAMEDLEGNPVDILDYVEEGKATLIEFWASWCEQCEALQPQLDRIHAEMADQINIVAVAVAVAQSQRRVKRHVEEHGAGYPYLWDASGNGVKAFEVPGTSIVVILDPSGNVAYTGTGAGQDLVGAVRAIIGGS